MLLDDPSSKLQQLDTYQLQKWQIALFYLKLYEKYSFLCITMKKPHYYFKS